MDYQRWARLAKDPIAIQRMARLIKKRLEAELSDQALDFLTRMEKFDDPEPLSMRQREWLSSLESRASRSSKKAGYRADHMVELLYMNRLEFPEDTEEIIVGWHKRGPSIMLSDNEWRHVFGLSRQIGEIDHYVEF